MNTSCHSTFQLQTLSPATGSRFLVCLPLDVCSPCFRLLHTGLYDGEVCGGLGGLASNTCFAHEAWRKPCQGPYPKGWEIWPKKEKAGWWRNCGKGCSGQLIRSWNISTMLRSPMELEALSSRFRWLDVFPPFFSPQWSVMVRKDHIGLRLVPR